MKMLYIRTDMNRFMATGHVMRCLSIAEAAVKLGKSVTFILADGQALELIRKRGFDAAVLHTEWNHMEEEIDALREVVKCRRDAVLLVDSYMATPGYLQVLSTWMKTAYIDDLGAEDYPVHILICYAGYWRKFHFSERYGKARLLLGMQYAPLGMQFQNLTERAIRSKVENILLLSGGTDRFGVLAGLLERLCNKEYRNITVICGQYYRDYDAQCRRFSGYSNIHFHKAVKNMRDYMIKADVAVSAGGTALYELCACGTPAVSYSFADNQLDNVRYFQKEDLIDYAGDVRDTDIYDQTALLLEKYSSLYELRRGRSQRMQELVDGKGAARIVQGLAEYYQSNRNSNEETKYE